MNFHFVLSGECDCLTEKQRNTLKNKTFSTIIIFFFFKQPPAYVNPADMTDSPT